MTADTVATFLIKRLMEWDVYRIYGYQGDGVNGITAALLRHEGPNDLATLRATVEQPAR